MKFYQVLHEISGLPARPESFGLKSLLRHVALLFSTQSKGTLKYTELNSTIFLKYYIVRIWHLKNPLSNTHFVNNNNEKPLFIFINRLSYGFL